MVPPLAPSFGGAAVRGAMRSLEEGLECWLRPTGKAGAPTHGHSVQTAAPRMP
jgi:hypothetical protein